MDCVGKGVLGLTRIQCGQCHDHKYDPLTQEDYRRMFAFFSQAAAVEANNVPVYTWSERQKIVAEINPGKTGEIEDLIKHQNPDWRERMAAWEKHITGAQSPQWVIVRPEVDEESTGGQKYILMEDGSFLAQGYAPTKHTVEMTVKTAIAPIRAVRLELLNVPNLPLGGQPVGRSKGDRGFDGNQIEAASGDGKGRRRRLQVYR